MALEAFGTALLKHSDGSILDINGTELFLGVERFKALVKDHSRCFLCGAHENSAPFNDEHIIPDWVQRKYQLNNKQIRLSNESKIRYQNYKIRCCMECNSFLGNTFELPISKAIHRGTDYFLDWYKNEIFRVFLWINLIFLKIHIKDNQLRLYQNQKAPDTRIGDLHDWAELHHCHAMIRAVRLGFEIDTQSTLGSVFCLALGDWAREQPYDYNDHLPTHTVMIRMGEIAFICSLNDSCGVLQGVMPIIERLPPDLNPFQFLELLTEFQFVNCHLKFRPEYITEIDPSNGNICIKGKTPDLFELEELDLSVRGDLMLRNIYGSFPNFSLDGMSVEDTKDRISLGNVSFIK